MFGVLRTAHQALDLSVRPHAVCHVLGQTQKMPLARRIMPRGALLCHVDRRWKCHASSSIASREASAAWRRVGHSQFDAGKNDAVGVS